jgi:flavin reductase (DIM6/NTAB) family NADH-FMN oxidoreductase RutF
MMKLLHWEERIKIKTSLEKAKSELISPLTIITVGNGKRNGFTAPLVSVVLAFSDPSFAYGKRLEA